MEEYKDIIISSRIRLARNIKGFNFPLKLSNIDANELIGNIFSCLPKYENYKVKELNKVILNSMKEKHLISQELIDNYEKSAVCISPDESICIMVNEEEHIRQQCILKGFKLDEALQKLNEVDDVLIDNLPILYDEQYGFLTTCPSNIGTGMRASVMLFLPALSILGKTESLINSLSKVGLVVRGSYGEGSNANGFMFQISNNQTLGLSEDEIITNVKTAVLKICEKEQEARNNLLNVKKEDLIDKTNRAYGILKYCYKINSIEATQLLSEIKLGVCLNILNCDNIINIDELMENILPNTLMNINGEEMTKEERDIFRAKYISQNI